MDVQTILAGEFDEVVDDLGTVRGFVARFLELGAYGLIALADNLRPGLAAAMAIDLLKTQRITFRVVLSARGEADAGCQQPPAPLPRLAALPRSTDEREEDQCESEGPGPDRDPRGEVGLMLYHPNARRHDCPQEHCVRCAVAGMCDSFDALADAIKAFAEGSRSLGFSLRKLYAKGERHRSRALRRSGRQPKAWRWNGSWRRYRPQELPDNLVRMVDRR